MWTENKYYLGAHTCVRVEMFPQMGALLESLAAHRARVPTVPAMDAQNMGLHVGVPREELEANATSMFITDLSQLANIRILVVLLVLMCLQHDPPLDGLVTGIALVRCIQIFVIGSTGKVVDRIGHYCILLVLSLLTLLAPG